MIVQEVVPARLSLKPTSNSLVNSVYILLPSGLRTFTLELNPGEKVAVADLLLHLPSELFVSWLGHLLHCETWNWTVTFRDIVGEAYCPTSLLVCRFRLI